MNREHAQELLPIIQAFAEGKDIQCKNNEGGWHEPSSDPHFNAGTVWQIKPEIFECWAWFPRETHINGDNAISFSSKALALNYLDRQRQGEGSVIHLREVEWEPSSPSTL